MATNRNKLVSLTDFATGAVFMLSSCDIINFIAVGGGSNDTLITYINQRGKLYKRRVTQSVSTIDTACISNTIHLMQPVTLDTGIVMYLNIDRVIYADDLVDSSPLVTIITYDAFINPRAEYKCSLPTAADFAAATDNMFAIVAEPSQGAPQETRYINNYKIARVATQNVKVPPVITFTTNVKSGTGLVTTAGSGYTAPTVSITGGGGTGAAGTLTSKIVSGVVASAGTGYIAGTSVITIAGGTSTTAAKYNVTESTLVSLSTNAAGTGYTPGDVLTMVGGTFSTAATLTVSHTKAVSATVAAGGTGNLADGSGVIVEGTTGTGTKFRASVTIATNAIASVQSISLAGDYTVNPTLITAEPVTYISGGTGTTLTGAQLSVVMGVLTAGVTTGGTYTISATSLTSTGTGTGATFNTALYGAKTLTVNTAGDYSVIPTNPVSQASATGGGTGATITASFGLLAFTIATNGTGYTSYPTFTVVDATGINGVITANMLVESPLTIVSGGQDINSSVTLTFSSGTTTATATATVTAQTVSSTSLTNAGSYKKGTDSYPTLAITGGAGSYIVYDEHKTEFRKLRVEATITAIQTAVNAL